MLVPLWISKISSISPMVSIGEKKKIGIHSTAQLVFRIDCHFLWYMTLGWCEGNATEWLSLLGARNCYVKLCYVKSRVDSRDKGLVEWRNLAIVGFLYWKIKRVVDRSWIIGFGIVGFSITWNLVESFPKLRVSRCIVRIISKIRYLNR